MNFPHESSGRSQWSPFFLPENKFTGFHGFSRFFTMAVKRAALSIAFAQSSDTIVLSL